MIILGVDPGTHRTGWGVVERKGARLHGIAAGVIKAKESDPLEARLYTIHTQLEAVIAEHKPAAMAVEDVFSKHVRSALVLGQARGVVLLAPARAGLPVFEYAARLVKKSVTGVGQADKRQIGMMVGRLLPGVDATADAADALAVAICHAHHRATRRFLAKRVEAAQ